MAQVTLGIVDASVNARQWEALVSMFSRLQAPELLPCPFCGSYDLEPPCNSVHVSVRCKNCNASGGAGFRSDAAIINWNKRV